MVAAVHAADCTGVPDPSLPLRFRANKRKRATDAAGTGVSSGQQRGAMDRLSTKLSFQRADVRSDEGRRLRIAPVPSPSSSAQRPAAPPSDPHRQRPPSRSPGRWPAPNASSSVSPIASKSNTNSSPSSDVIASAKISDPARISTRRPSPRGHSSNLPRSPEKRRGSNGSTPAMMTRSSGLRTESARRCDSRIPKEGCGVALDRLNR